MYRIINHRKGDKHSPGTVVRWANNTIAVVQNDGRHTIITNNNSFSNQAGGNKTRERENRQEEWENEWEREIQRQKKKHRK